MGGSSMRKHNKNVIVMTILNQCFLAF